MFIEEIIMNEECYNEGYQAARNGEPEDCNPFIGIEAEHWADGYADAIEDMEQE
jgi:ribosome modulation factor